MVRRLAVASSLIVLFAAGGIRVLGARDRDQQTPPAVAPTPTPSPTPKVDEEDGTPITSAAVKTACGDCHSEDAKHRFTRISYRRTTPEGWQETIRRMVSLNKASIEPDEAREVVKYLSDHLGLAPEEAKPAAFEVGAPPHRLQVHGRRRHRARLLELPLARPRDLQRRTERGVGPADRHAPRLVPARRPPGVPPHRARRRREPGADGRPPDNRHPMEKALDHLRRRVSADDAGMDGVVGDDAQPAARRHVGAQRATRPARARSTAR